MEYNKVMSIVLLVAFIVFIFYVYQLFEAQKSCEPQQRQLDIYRNYLANYCVGTCVAMCEGRNVTR